MNSFEHKWTKSEIFEPIKIVYYFSSVAVVKKGNGQKFRTTSKNCQGLGSDFTIEFFSGLVLRIEGRQGRVD